MRPDVLRVMLAAAALALGAAGSQARTCALSVTELRALVQQPGFALRWQETTMADGKPLVVTLSERDGGLHLQFVKLHEGLWAEGPASVCLDNGVMEAAVPGHGIRLGPAAHWLLRHSLAGGARFALSLVPGGRLRIATPGWSGMFLPLAD